MTLKDAIAYCLVIALGLILIVHFVLFWIYGGIFIYEKNKIILTTETVLSLGIILFGLERIISAAVQNKRVERAKPGYRADGP